MEFFIKSKPEFKAYFQPGMELKLSMGERFIWVAITKLEGENVFFEATCEDERYLQALYDEKYEYEKRG